MDIPSGGLVLRGHLARPAETSSDAGRALVLCHGFPSGPRGRGSGHTYPQLADRLAELSGWTVLAFNFRGTGDSEGDFSLGGWMADVRAAIDTALGLDGVTGTWLAGFDTGGALAICAAGEDDRVRGVAALGAPADFDDWALDPDRLLDQARRLGIVRASSFPDGPDGARAWARELAELRPLALVGKVKPRPVLIVHGSDDAAVPLVDARALADAAEGEVELRVLPGAGHRLAHDPRAMAVLLGWLGRLER
ncbi:MAG: alpha/beta hydrolase [Acidimicrobiales bacterium]